MSTEAAIPTPTTPYKLLRGGAYLIEGVLQRTEYTTTIGLTRRAARLRRKLRDQNKAVDFEKAMVRKPTETDIEWSNRQVEHNERFTEWSEQSVILELTDKEKTFLKEKALKWAFSNRDKVFPQNNDSVLSIIEAFDLEDDGE